MKIKQHVMISNADDFLHQSYRSCFTLMDSAVAEIFTGRGEDSYIDCGEIELDINVSGEDVTASVLSSLNAEIEREQAEHSLKMDMLNTRKQELLALPVGGEG